MNEDEDERRDHRRRKRQMKHLISFAEDMCDKVVKESSNIETTKAMNATVVSNASFKLKKLITVNFDLPKIKKKSMSVIPKTRKDNKLATQPPITSGIINSVLMDHVNSLVG